MDVYYIGNEIVKLLQCTNHRLEEVNEHLMSSNRKLGDIWEPTLRHQQNSRGTGSEST